jgi:phage terminase large subunit
MENEVTVEVDYDPNDKQMLFHVSDTMELLYGGAKGGGKSCALVMDAFMYGYEYAGAKIYLFRETYDDLEANLIEEMKQKIPEDLYSYHESKHIATLKNGTKIYFRYIQNYKDAQKYQGRSIDYIGVDELTKHEEKSIQELLSCVRSPKGFPPQFRATCNPGGIGHAWVKRRYIEGTNYGNVVAIDKDTDNKIQFIPAQVYDNKILMENDPAYVKRLENLPEDKKKAFLYGDWDIFEGQYFKEWKREKHVIRPFRIPDHWRRYRSIDWGYNDHCAVYWHTTDEDGHIYTYRELYIRETSASDVAKKMVEISKYENDQGELVDEKIHYTVASPDMWQKRGNHTEHNPQKSKIKDIEGQSIAETFFKNGVPLIKADNARIVGWDRMRENLKDAPDGDPYWRIFETCSNLTRTLPELIYDEIKVEDVSDKVEDHAPESCRYFLMSRPSPSHELKPKESKIQKHKKRLIKKSKEFTNRRIV